MNSRAALHPVIGCPLATRHGNQGRKRAACFRSILFLHRGKTGIATLRRPRRIQCHFTIKIDGPDALHWPTGQHDYQVKDTILFVRTAPRFNVNDGSARTGAAIHDPTRCRRGPHRHRAALHCRLRHILARQLG